MGARSELDAISLGVHSELTWELVGCQNGSLLRARYGSHWEFNQRSHWELVWIPAGRHTGSLIAPDLSSLGVQPELAWEPVGSHHVCQNGRLI